MNHNPFFSIVIPVFNRDALVGRCIRSVLSQSFKDFEIIIIDNGSTDNTAKVVESFSESRIKYFYQKGTGSPANPRNNGIKYSHGEWICFLDSDDWWREEKLFLVYDALKKSSYELDVICHNENFYFEEKSKIGKKIFYGPRYEDMYKNLLIYGNCLSTSATSVRSKFIKDNNIQFREERSFAMVEDYDFWLNIANYGGEFLFLKESLGYYSISDFNMIANKDSWCKNLKTLLYHHTNNIQNFCLNKNKLSNLVNIRVKLCSILYSRFYSLFEKISKIFFVFIASPMKFTQLLFGYLRKRILSRYSK